MRPPGRLRSAPPRLRTAAPHSALRANLPSPLLAGYGSHAPGIGTGKETAGHRSPRLRLSALTSPCHRPSPIPPQDCAGPVPGSSEPSGPGRVLGLTSLASEECKYPHSLLEELLQHESNGQSPQCRDEDTANGRRPTAEALPLPLARRAPRFKYGEGKKRQFGDHALLRFAVLFCSPLPKPLHSAVTSTPARPGPALVPSGRPVGYHLLLRLRLRILCPSGGPSASWDPFPSRPPGPHWPGPPQQFESLTTGRDRSQDHRLPSEVPAALPVLLPGTFELVSALPRALPELGQLLGLLQQPTWAPLPPFLHPGAGLPPLLHCGAAFPFLLVLLAGPQPLLLHHRPACGASPRRRAPPVRAVRRPPHHPQTGFVAPAAPLLHPRAHAALLLHRRTHAPLLLHAELQPAELLRAPAENPDPLRLLLRQPWAEPAALFLHDSPPGAPSRHCPTHSPAPQRPRGPAPPDGAVLGVRSHLPAPGCFRPVPRGRGLRGSVPSRSAPRPGPGSLPSLLGVEVRPPGAAPCAGPRRYCGPARRPKSQERPPSRRSSWSPPAPAPPQGGGAQRD
nr:transcription initiation factor TFIID subunit 4-like [Bubalus bubalis]